jgi:hypothetical protein
MSDDRSKRRLRIVVAAVALTLLALGGATLAQDGDGYALPRWSADGGGATASRAGAYILGGTAGQPDAGALHAGTYTLGGGFWGGGQAETAPVGHRVLLPVVVRSDS